jgi:hypothetical protein
MRSGVSFAAFSLQRCRRNSRAKSVFVAASTSEFLKAVGESTRGPFNFNLSSFLRAGWQGGGLYNSRLE